MSRMMGGEGSDRSSSQSGAFRGARMGAAAGPLGMAVGAAAGWLQGRIQQGRIASASTRMASDSSARAAQGVNWGLDSDSPLAQFNGQQSDAPAATPSTESEAPQSEGGGGGSAGAGWSGVIGPGANGETLIRGTTQFGSGGAGGASKFYRRGGSSAK